MAETISKLKRSAHLLFLNATPAAETPKWFLIGKDVEDLSVSLNPDTSVKKNILDENSVVDNGYEPSIEVDTYYANPKDGEFYIWLKDLALNRRTGDECKTQILETLIDKTQAPYDAWREDAIIKPQSYGGPQGGISIPYTITLCGNRTKGNVTITDKVPSFTEEENVTE